MDRRHGKRPLPSEASEEKERDPQQHHDFPPNYESNWTEADMSAMVSALTQVIGTTEDHHQGTVVQSNPSSISHSIVKEEPDRPQPVQEQGMIFIFFSFLYFFFLHFFFGFGYFGV